MNMVDKVVKAGISDTEKVDLCRLYYLYTIAFFIIIIFVYLLFLLEVSEVSNY